jgi:hypothetical protein
MQAAFHSSHRSLGQFRRRGHRKIFDIDVSDPGGSWILSPKGKHLGTIIAPRHPHNMPWGEDDGKSFYLCARDKLYKIRLNIPGIRL